MLQRLVNLSINDLKIYNASSSFLHNISIVWRLAHGKQQGDIKPKELVVPHLTARACVCVCVLFCRMIHIIYQTRNSHVPARTQKVRTDVAGHDQLSFVRIGCSKYVLAHITNIVLDQLRWLLHILVCVLRVQVQHGNTIRDAISKRDHDTCIVRCESL